jgi:hypothetical protein
MKFVGGGLKPLAVDAERRVSLDGVADLSMETVDAGINAVLKKPTKGG